MEADCSFLITTALISNGDFYLCVQANDQVSAQSWEVYQYNLSSTPVQTGTNPNMCWSLDGNGPHIIIHHSVDGGNPCTRVIRIVSDELCPEGIVQADVQNCNLETVVSIDDSNIGVPYAITFGDGSLAQESSASEITYTYGQSGTYDICLTYLAPGYEAGYITCCYSVEIALPQECECPENFVEVVSVEPCTWSANLFFEPSFADLPVEVDFGDGTSEIVDDNLFTHVFPGPGNYNLCYTKEVFPGNTITCCQQVNIPGCCLDPYFELSQEISSPSCLNPLYKVSGQACPGNILDATHIWTFSDSTVYFGPDPPDHLFTNFVNDTGYVCVTHTIICCEDTASYTACMPHTQGAYLGTPGEVLYMTQILPFTNQTVLQFIQQHANSPTLPLTIDGTIVVDTFASFFGGTWNMGRNSEIIVRGNLSGPYMNFWLSAVTIRSAVRLPGSPPCCRWKGIRSEGLTFIRAVNSWFMDADYAMRYTTKLGVTGSPYPKIYSVNNQYVNNYYGIKSESQYVVFNDFRNNVMEGASHDPQVCDCNAVNAFDFSNVDPLLTVKIVPSYFLNYNNTIFNYEQAFNFSNTNLIVRGFEIHSLRDYEPVSLPKNNPDGDAAIGIEYQWNKSASSVLDMDYIRFFDFEGQNTSSLAVRDRVYNGHHTLKAEAGEALSSITTSNLAGGYQLFASASAKLNGTITGNSIHTNGGPLYGFGINGNILSSGNSIRIQDNDFSIGSNTNSLLNGGVILASATEIAQGYRINDNDIEVLLPAGAGIGITNAIGSNVRRNTLTGAPFVDGILLREGRNGRIDCNNIQSYARGISVESSSQNQYGANYLLGNKHDMVFTGDAQGANGSGIWWNNFITSANESLLYNAGAITGKQHHRRYNYWQGQFGVEARHLSGPGPSALACQFWYPSGAAVGSIHRPASVPVELFSLALLPGTEGFPSTFCEDEIYELDGNPPLDSLWDPIAEWTLLVGDTAFWGGLTEAEQTFLRQEIYGLLLEHPDWTTGSTLLSDFQAAAAAGFIGQSETLKRNWQTLLQDISGHHASLAPARHVLDSLSNLTQLWIEAMHTDTTLQDSLSLLLAAVLADGDSLTTLLEQADALFFEMVQDSIGELLSQNAALDDTEWHTWYEKRYNEIALTWLTGAQPDSASIADLRTIAQTCLADGGRAVLGARGLCEVWLREHYSEDGCQGIPEERSAKPETQAHAFPELTVVPNPASDVVRIYLNVPADRETMQVQVLNMNGQLIYGTVMPASGELVVPVGGWSEGIYVISVTGNSVALSKVLVVQSR